MTQNAILVNIQNLANRCVALRSDLRRLYALNPDASMTIRSEGPLATAYRKTREEFEKKIAQQQKRELWRVEATLSKAYAVTIDLERGAPTEYEDRNILKTMEENKELIKSAYIDLPHRMSLSNAETVHLRNSWYMLGVMFYRGEIQPLRVRLNRMIFEDFRHGRIGDLEAYYFTRVMMTFSATGQDNKFGQYSSHSYLLQMQFMVAAEKIDKFQRAFSIFKYDHDLHTVEHLQSLYRMLDIIIEDLSHLFNTSRRYFLFKPKLPWQDEVVESLYKPLAKS